MTLARAVFHFDGGLHCYAGVLTCELRCSIAGVECRICAPGPTPAWVSQSGGPLEPPRDEMHHKVAEWPSDGWGMINSSNLVTIYAVGIEVLARLPSSDDELLQFDRAVADWMGTFQDWLTVLAEGPTGFEHRRFSMQWTTEDFNRRLTSASYSAGDFWEPEPITLWTWQHACRHAAVGDEPPLARKLLALAKRDAARGETRTAVIHAATAAECAITKELTRSLRNSYSEEDTQIKMDKHRMLGGRLNLARKLGLSIRGDARKDLLEPRNTVVHGHGHISDQDAWRAIRIASMMVEDFDPLPQHCQEPPPERPIFDRDF